MFIAVTKSGLLKFNTLGALKTIASPIEKAFAGKLLSKSTFHLLIVRVPCSSEICCMLVTLWVDCPERKLFTTTSMPILIPVVFIMLLIPAEIVSVAIDSTYTWLIPYALLVTFVATLYISTKTYLCCSRTASYSIM